MKLRYQLYLSIIFLVTIAMIVAVHSFEDNGYDPLSLQPDKEATLESIIESMDFSYKNTPSQKFLDNLAGEAGKVTRNRIENLINDCRIQTDFAIGYLKVVKQSESLPVLPAIVSALERFQFIFHLDSTAIISEYFKLAVEGSMLSLRQFIMEYYADYDTLGGNYFQLGTTFGDKSDTYLLKTTPLNIIFISQEDSIAIIGYDLFGNGYPDVYAEISVLESVPVLLTFIQFYRIEDDRTFSITTTGNDFQLGNVVYFYSSRYDSARNFEEIIISEVMPRYLAILDTTVYNYLWELRDMINSIGKENLLPPNQKKIPTDSERI